jgi:hypothetical protein
MALYVGLSLLAVMVALPLPDSPRESATPALTIALTALGLILAHVIAFRVSTRLTHGGQLPPESLELLSIQLVAGAGVTVLAMAPVLLFGAPNGVIVSELVLLGLVATFGYAAARAVPLSRTRAMLYVAGVVIATLVVLVIKNAIPH